MKFTFFFCLVLCLHLGSSTWLGDVFTGLSEGLDNEFGEHKEIWTAVKSKIKDSIKKATSNRTDKWIDAGSKILEKWQILGKETLKKAPGIKSHMKEKIISQWNELLQKITSGKKDLNIKHMMHKLKRVHARLEKVVPVELYKEMKDKAESVLKKWKESLPTKKIEKMKKILKEHVKDWKQPLFMKKTVEKMNKKVLEKYVKDAVKIVNSHIEKASGMITPVKIDKEEDPEEEKKLNSWIAKNFQKPHKKFGTGSWGKLNVDPEEINDFTKDLLEKSDHGKIAKYIKKAMANGEDAGTDEEDPKIDADDSPLKDILKGTDPPMSNEETKEFEKAEKKWEEDLAKETKKLIVNLKPADAYVVPDLKDDEPDKGSTAKVFVNNKKDAREHETKDDPFEDYMEPDDKKKKIIFPGEKDPFTDYQKTSDYQWVKKKVDGDKFGKDLADLESNWFGLRKSLKNKLSKFEKKMIKK